MELTDVDLTWPPDKIREFCENNDNWALWIPDEWTSAEIEALYQRQLTVARPYVGVISEIAGDPRASTETLTDIWTRFGASLEVASALATNPALPSALRRELSQHADSDVREHARARVHKFPGNVFAIVRVDDYLDSSVALEHRFTVTGVVPDLSMAEREVRRLNALNSSKGRRYFWQATRLKELRVK